MRPALETVEDGADELLREVVQRLFIARVGSASVASKGVKVRSMATTWVSSLGSKAPSHASVTRALR